MSSIKNKMIQQILASHRIVLFVIVLIIPTLYGCEKTQVSSKQLPPVTIRSGDECHVCGMTIDRFPGPKGEAYVHGASKPFKFCSTRDLFSWWLQPENKIAATSVYVHDMGNTNWTHPSDKDFVDARTAWYVINQPLPGAMGPTIASFAKKSDAEKFIKKHGGELFKYEDISLKILANLKGPDDFLHNASRHTKSN